MQKYNGVFVEKRYLPIMHPNMTIFKPQLNDDIVAAFSKIKPILEDENVGQMVDEYGTKWSPIVRQYDTNW